MWKILFDSVAGSSHRAGGLPCQDSCAAIELPLADEVACVLACSDGAGSAPLSDVGSRAACDAVLLAVARELAGQASLAPIRQETAQGWYAAALEELSAEAERREAPPRDLACTLLVAVAGRAGAAFCQIGDGAIVCRAGDLYCPVFWPQSGEYANTTTFLTSPRYEQSLAFEWREGPVNEIALFSDGLQMLALEYAARAAHQGFFSPMFASLRECSDPAQLAAPLRDFLSSERIEERTDDDKTLILAARAQEDGKIL